MFVLERRKVSVKDLNPCDIQGYLYQRLRNKHTQNGNWEKRWFVLTGNLLYGFKNKDVSKCLFNIKNSALIFVYFFF